MSARPRPVAVTIASSSHAMRLPRKALADLIAFVARRERARVAEVDLAIVTRRQMAAFNRRWLTRPGPTDVLSFDLAAPGEPVSAQIIVCDDLAVAEAAARDIPPRRELMLYVLHGLLHLLGHDDTTPRQAARMHARQEELLALFLACGARQQATGRTGTAGAHRKCAGLPARNADQRPQ
jgi:probable rRNA maturation factor